ncbi:hypothetical protein RvVAR0630_30440 [Agrobacterium vitis]|uniref:hypothetical protein n=1 Tax=Agrobacterium vitis TaxID=373 RepID=UPI0015D8A440|nr:hypothetical protein [Agrobacterium vitis]BCH60420.1 hypothetical protein RvVAR0630_30440 [Agrobacterium vitis]
MVKTAAEYQRAYRERLKEREKEAVGNADEAFKMPFHEFMADHWSDVTTYLEWSGVDVLPDYAADGDHDPDWVEETDGPYRGALGRAERMVGHYLDAANTLAMWINRYKEQEINARIAELEASDLNDPDARKQALADIVKLTKYRDQLSKQVRWTLPQWKVKGE